MRPRLVLLSSPLSGQIFPVGPEGLSIGRHPDNRLLVTDRSASRFHCVVEASEGRFRVRDLESRQGTFVNGRPVREHLLDEGDLVTVGDLLLLFQIQDAEPACGEPAVLDGEGFTARTTSRLPTQDLLRTRPDFQTLLRIAGILQAARSTAELARGLLDQVLETLPGDRAALLLADRGSDDIAAAFAVDRRRGAGDPFPVSRTVIQAVLGEGVTLKAEDVLLEERLAGAESLRADR
ncbi:MAG TPA: FHA domain-containing protein, partial [Thermoanaerobaculia bacterium]